jgi:uncharacterized protein YdaU (DUF1376 family)
MHYFQFNIADYRSATTHLSNDEDLAYRRLLDMYYDTEQKIPLDAQWVARRLRMGTEVVETVLADMFEKHEDGWFHARCEEVIQQYKEFAEAGKRGAAKRWGNKGVTPPNREANGEATSPPNPPPIATINYKLRTNNQELKTNSSVSKDTGVKTPLSPDEIIFGYGLPFLTNAGTAEKQARTFLGGLRKVHGDEVLVNTLRDCIKAKPLQPLEWLAKALPPDGVKPKMNKQEALEASNWAVAQRLLKKEGLA